MLKSRLRLALLLLLALLCSALLAELVVRHLLRFPASGIAASYHIYPGDAYKGSRAFENLYQPHAPYFNVENGYQIFHKNNYGLPGTDLRNDGTKTIYLLGNSFIEARSTRPEEMASTRLKDYLEAASMESYQVLNLGTGGQAPLFTLYRAKFWEASFPATKVILVLEASMLKETQASPDSVFAPDAAFGKPVMQRKDWFINSLTAKSALAYLLLSAKYQHEGRLAAAKPVPRLSKAQLNKQIAENYRRLWQVINQYHQLYGERFMLYSLLDDWHNRNLTAACREAGIAFACNSKLRRIDDYHLGEGHYGHFNSRGNRRLADELFRFLAPELLLTIPEEVEDADIPQLSGRK